MTRLIQFPKTPRQWVIALASAVVGFFTGGAAITVVQRLLRKVLY